MFLFDERTDKIMDISADWSAATGERLKATAHLRAGLVASVVVEDGKLISMCRSAAAAILSHDVVRSIEASASAARSA